MRSFHDCLPRDGAAKIISLISHITLLNEEKEPNALSLIKDAAFAIIAGDCMGAYKLYHDCARKLLLSPARRVSGVYSLSLKVAFVLGRQLGQLNFRAVLLMGELAERK